MPELTFPIQENSLSSGIRTHAYMQVRKYTHYLRDIHTIGGICFSFEEELASHDNSWPGKKEGDSFEPPSDSFHCYTNS